MKRAESLPESFRYAFRGLWYALKTQRNLRWHVTAASWILALAWVAALPRREFISVLAAIMVVMVAEMINTAIEATVDLASPQHHHLAQIAKDVAAGAVLLAAIGAATLGIWVFGPHLFLVSKDFMVRWHHSWVETIGVLAALYVESGFMWYISRIEKNKRRPGPFQ